MSRASIFSKIRTALEPIGEKAGYPDYDNAILASPTRLEGGDLREIFTRNFTAASSKLVDSIDELIAYLKDQQHLVGYCDPELMASVGDALAAAGLEVHTTYDRATYDIYRFGITRATGAIAESGTLVLDDALTSDRLAALSPWVHIAVLPAASIHRSVSDGIAALGKSRNAIWITGPSKTADVEGILIEGVHGPGIQIALFL